MLMNDFIKKALPWLGTALGGPLGGMALSAIGDALGISDATEASIKTAIAGATPEQMLALKKADQDFALQMQQMGLKNVTDLEAIAAGDRASARAREVAVRDKTPSILAYFVTLGFFGILTFMLVRPLPVDGHDALMVMLGSLGTAWAGVISYFFGSSAGSAKKDTTIANMNK
jgi:hypothetical protein